MTTTAPVLDAEEHSTVIKATITANLGTWKAYDYDQVPGSKLNPIEAERRLPLPGQYALVTVERRFVPALRATAQAGRSSWRVTVLAVGRTVGEAQWMQSRIDQALDENQLTIGGRLTTPLLFELSQTPEPDEGRFTGRSQYTYTI